MGHIVIIHVDINSFIDAFLLFLNILKTPEGMRSPAYWRTDKK